MIKTQATRVIFISLLFLFLLPSVWQPLAAPGHFWISNLEGKRFNSRKQTNTAIISFFFVDCVPCKVEVPQLHAMMKKDYPESGLLFVDPVGDDSASYIKEFADQAGVPYGFFYRDPIASMAKKYFKGKMVFPTIVGVKGGRELFRVHDLNPESLEKLRAALAK